MQKLTKKTFATPPPAPIRGERLREVVGGGAIQDRAFGAGKYGIELGG